MKSASTDSDGSSVRKRFCPGCGWPYKEHTWGQPRKFCQGPEIYLLAGEMKLASAKGPVEGLPDDTKGSLPHPDLRLQSDESDMSCNQSDNEDKTSKDGHLEDDHASVANLTLMLQELVLEEEALLKKRKLNELKEVVAAK